MSTITPDAGAKSESQRDSLRLRWQSWLMHSETAPTSRPLAIVSGGSRGLGLETARGLAAAGFDLALIAKDAQRLEGARQSLLSEFAATFFDPYFLMNGSDFVALHP